MAGGAARRLVIFGGPGSGAVVAQYAANAAAAGEDVRVLGFLNDREPVGTLVAGLPVLGTFADWPAQPADVTFLAPLHKAKEMPGRAALIDGLGVPADRWARLVDPQTVRGHGVEIGHGSHVGAFAHLQAGVRLGAHVGVRGGAFIGHDCSLGDHVFFGANAFAAGYGQVGHGAHIGPMAALRENVRVGRFAIVGMGAVVLRDVPDHTIVAGNPAVPIGRVEPDPAP